MRGLSRCGFPHNADRNATRSLFYCALLCTLKRVS